MARPVPDFYRRYPEPLRGRLLALRALILETAEQTAGVGAIEEALRWNQPSFLTVRPQTGSTIRIDAVDAEQGSYGAYFICHTSLVDRFRELYPDSFTFEGNRALIFAADDPLPVAELKHCFAMALTYKLGRTGKRT